MSVAKPVVRSRIVPIGNSAGIRIPKALRTRCRLEGEVELAVEGDALVVRPARRPREGWDAAFARMARRGEDALLDGEALAATTWDEEEWKW